MRRDTSSSATSQNAANIKSVIIDEFDSSPNDDHVAFDSVVFSAQQKETEPNNELTTATALPLMEDPVGSGFFTSSVALGSIDPVISEMSEYGMPITL